MRPSARGPARLRSERRLPLGREGERERQADDRLDAGLGHGFRKFERAEEIVGVRQRERGRPVGFGQRGKLGNGERPFEQRIG